MGADLDHRQAPLAAGRPPLARQLIRLFRPDAEQNRGFLDGQQVREGPRRQSVNTLVPNDLVEYQEINQFVNDYPHPLI